MMVSLIGFSDEQTSLIGQISLHVYAGGVNLKVKFLIVNDQSAYNAILRRPWIHVMKAVPLMYH